MDEGAAGWIAVFINEHGVLNVEVEKNLKDFPFDRQNPDDIILIEDDGLEKNGRFIDNDFCSLAGTKRKYGGAPELSEKNETRIFERLSEQKKP